MTLPVLIAQISDLHIKRPGEHAYEMVDTAAALARCIGHLNAFRPRPDYVVISGDLVDRGLEEEYAHMRYLLGRLELPFAAVPGNHVFTVQCWPQAKTWVAGTSPATGICLERRRAHR